MEKVEQNTKNFYEELKGDCDIEKLKNIAKEKIFLYEPLFKYDKIKYDPFVIKTSFESYQNFMIYTLEQYNEFINLVKQCNDNNSNYIDTIYPYEVSYKNTLFILNKELINFLVKDKDNESTLNTLLKFHENGCSIYLYYLYKYNIISLNTFNMFKLGIVYKEAIVIIYVFNYFYLNDKFYDITKLLKFMEREYIISTIVDIFGRDINILNYVIKNLVKGSLIDSKRNIYRIPSTFPMSTLKEYTSKIYKPNEKYLNCSKDKNTELFFNTVCSDVGLDFIYDASSNNYYLPYSVYFNRYNVKFNIPKTFSYTKVNNKKTVKNTVKDTDSFKFENRELFDIPAFDPVNFVYSERGKYVRDKVNKFIEKYYTDECDCNDYYKLNEGDIEDYDIDSDFSEITDYCNVNYHIFPFGSFIVGYEYLEYLITDQLKSFKERIFDNDNVIQEILNNIDSSLIFNYINEYKDNHIFVSILKILYIISLIHNNYSTFIILIFVHNTCYNLEYKNNCLYFIERREKCMSLEYEFYNLFNSNNIIKKHIKLIY